MKDLKVAKLAVIFALLMSVLNLEAQFVQGAFSTAPQANNNYLLPYDPQTGTWPAQTTTQLGIRQINFTIAGSNPDPTFSFGRAANSGSNQPPNPAITAADGTPVNSGSQLPAGNYAITFPPGHN